MSAVATDLGGRADERELLCGFLDWLRAVVERKVDGLSLEEATRVMTPTGLSVLGVVQHLAWVQRLWFRWRFAWEDVDVADEGQDFAIRPGATIESVLEGYRDESDRARRITAAASLDDLSANEHTLYGRVSLRWILVHEIEETARHAGHLDLMREQVDGRTGD